VSLETTATVTLGGKEYVAKAVPVAKLMRLARELSGVAESLQGVDATDTDQVFEGIVGQLGTSLDAFFRTFIPTLPKGLFEDEEKGPSLPEIVEAVKTVVTLNRIDTLGNFLRQLGLQVQLQTAYR